jgi:hypothetical protein
MYILDEGRTISMARFTDAALVIIYTQTNIKISFAVF